MIDYGAVNASGYVQSASITSLIATFDATHPPSRISQNTRHCSAAHAVCASAHGCRPCRAASGAPPVPRVGEPPTPPPLPEPGPPIPACAPDACEPGGTKPLLMASACSDIIRRLAACRSASRSSAVWRLEWTKQHTYGYTTILVNAIRNKLENEPINNEYLMSITTYKLCRRLCSIPPQMQSPFPSCLCVCVCRKIELSIRWAKPRPTTSTAKQRRRHYAFKWYHRIINTVVAATSNG